MADDDYCYLTTTGRRTGNPHRIEIWYAAAPGVLYLLAGGGRGSDWVQNLVAEPRVLVEIDGEEHRGDRARDRGCRRGRGAGRSCSTSTSRAPEGTSPSGANAALPVALDLADGRVGV